MASKKYVPIPGSEREPMPGATKSGPCDSHESVQVTVVLRPRPLGKKVEPLGEVIATGERLTRSQYEARYGADPKDVERVRAFALAHGLKVIGVNRGARSVKLRGTTAACSKAFQVDLAQYQGPEATYRGRTGPVYIPAALKTIIVSVQGLDNRPQAQPHFRLAPNRQSTLARASASSSVSYTPPQVGRLYDFRPAPTARAKPSASSSWAAATRNPT